MFASISRPSVRLVSSSLRHSRNVSHSLHRLPNNNQSSAKNYIPMITVSACALTSASMYYYFMNRVKNDTEDPQTAPAEETPVEVIEVVEEVIETIPAPAPQQQEQALEEEAKSEGAFNEETGEINWDCPCLGGMAHGPCGEEFKAAFSCFVYSKEEPKGIECIDKFKNMQLCFGKYPEIYSEELRDEETLEKEVVQTERAVDQAVMNNDIIESIEEAVEEAHEIEAKVKKSAIDLYASAQKKIDDFNAKK